VAVEQRAWFPSMNVAWRDVGRGDQAWGRATNIDLDRDLGLARLDPAWQNELEIRFRGARSLRSLARVGEPEPSVSWRLRAFWWRSRASATRSLGFDEVIEDELWPAGTPVRALFDAHWFGAQGGFEMRPDDAGRWRVGAGFHMQYSELALSLDSLVPVPRGAAPVWVMASHNEADWAVLMGFGTWSEWRPVQGLVFRGEGAALLDIVPGPLLGASGGGGALQSRAEIGFEWHTGPLTWQLGLGYDARWWLRTTRQRQAADFEAFLGGPVAMVRLSFP
jgi:hypothetical protein